MHSNGLGMDVKYGQFPFYSNKVKQGDPFMIAAWHIVELSNPLCWQLKSAEEQAGVKYMQMIETEKLKTAVLFWRETNGFSKW